MRSDQRMSGYLNRPEATADTITADDWLRTGDIGHLDDDGYLYIEDRLKDMIITGGENVYGPEVESVLHEHPGIADAAIIGVPDEKWGESVKAIVVAGTELEPAEVIEFCRQHLAGYKCPRTVDFVDELPRNASGKTLKNQLREPYWKDRSPESVTRAYRTPTKGRYEQAVRVHQHRCCRSYRQLRRRGAHPRGL